MLVRLTRHSRPVLGAPVAAGLVAGVLAGTARAFNPQPDPPFGMVGIAQGQTARINLVNTESPGALPPPCRAYLRFLDSDGNALATLAVEAAAGHATFLDYAANFVPVNTVGDAATPLRAEIRPIAHFDGNRVPPPCRVTVEIFDNATGRTNVLFPTPWVRGASVA